MQNVQSWGSPGTSLKTPAVEQGFSNCGSQSGTRRIACHLAAAEFAFQ